MMCRVTFNILKNKSKSLSIFKLVENIQFFYKYKYIKIRILLLVEGLWNKSSHLILIGSISINLNFHEIS